MHRYAIVGMGRSGEAARKYLLRKGVFPDEIITFDSKPGVADFDDPSVMMKKGKPRVLVVSPGVPLALPWIQEAFASGVTITSEISLAAEIFTQEKVIGVTGSVGKSTTVALLGEGARAVDRNAFVGGNFGVPLCEYAEGVLSGQRARAHWVILELSSFQLENCRGLKLDLAGLVSLHPNHLERYRDLTHYYETKLSIRDVTKGSVFYNRRGGDLAEMEKQLPQSFVSTDSTHSLLQGFHLEEARLIGDHNQDNLALAASLALAARWPEQAIERMKLFPGLPHRLENLGSVGGVRFINDSKATAISSVRIAAESAVKNLQSPGGKVHLLLGGRDKNLPWDELSQFLHRPDFQFYFFGECRELARQKSGLSGDLFQSLRGAVEAAKANAQVGDIVLLSPGGTSLDEFKSFEHRGDFFRSLI